MTSPHSFPKLFAAFVLLLSLLGCAGEPCKSACESDDDCEDGLVCLSPLDGDSLCLPEECSDCPDACSVNFDPVAETCDFRGCG